MTINPWNSTFPSPCSASDPKSFAYESTVKRWPTIITSIIDSLASLNGLTNLNNELEIKKVEESKELIRNLAGLIYEIRHDRDLLDLEG